MSARPSSTGEQFRDDLRGIAFAGVPARPAHGAPVGAEVRSLRDAFSRLVAGRGRLGAAA